MAFTGDDKQPFIIGGGEIYTLFLEVSHTIELTRIHNSFEADAFFPAIDTTKWLLITEEKNMPTQDQPYTYSYLTYKKIS